MKKRVSRRDFSRTAAAPACKKISPSPPELATGLTTAKDSAAVMRTLPPAVTPAVAPTVPIVKSPA